MMVPMTSKDQQTSLRRCGLPMALFATGTMALLTFGFVAADAQQPGCSRAGAQDTGPAVPADRKAEIEKVVKDYLLANPEILVQMQQTLEAKMEKEQTEKTKAALKTMPRTSSGILTPRLPAIRMAMSPSSNSSTITAAIAAAASMTS